MVSITSIATQFDPATMHPAAILPVKEISVLAGRVADGTYAAEEMHPASLPSAERLIRDGYGELILRVKNVDGSLRPVTRDEYAKAYLIFQKYAPQLCDDPKPLEKSRIQMMREELQAINPNMVATFIPRTLFELIFIKNILKNDEELQTRPCSSFSEFNDLLNKNRRSYGIEVNSLEITTMSDVEKHLPQLLEVGYRINQAAIEEINQIGKHVVDLSYSQIQKLLDAQIVLLEENVDPKKLLRKAVFIESHESSIGKIILYRGGEIAKDSPIFNGFPYSVSLGISIFAGVLTDTTAWAYFYMCHRDAYSFILDPAKESSREIRILPLTAIEALFGTGEMWHCRYLCSKDECENPKSPDAPDAIKGVYIDGIGFEPGMSVSDKYKLLKNHLTRQQTVEKFESLKEKNLFLFHYQNEVTA